MEIQGQRQGWKRYDRDKLRYKSKKKRSKSFAIFIPEPLLSFCIISRKVVGPRPPCSSKKLTVPLKHCNNISSKVFRSLSLSNQNFSIVYISITQRQERWRGGGEGKGEGVERGRESKGRGKGWGREGELKLCCVLKLERKIIVEQMGIIEGT